MHISTFTKFHFLKFVQFNHIQQQLFVKVHIYIVPKKLYLTFCNSEKMQTDYCQKGLNVL